MFRITDHHDMNSAVYRGRKGRNETNKIIIRSFFGYLYDFLFTNPRLTAEVVLGRSNFSVGKFNLSG